MSNHLFDAFASSAPAEAPLMTDESGRSWTYGAMLDASAALAARLVELGVGIGDRIVVQAEKTPELLFLYLASLRCGAVYVPLNTGYTLSELDYFIGDAEPKLIVVDPSAHGEVEALSSAKGARVATLDARGQGSLTAGLEPVAHADHAPAAREADDLASLIYTSGTTGRSKGAMLTHGNLLSNAQVLKEYWRFTPADRLIHALPIFHVHGLFVAANVTLVTGSSMIFLPKFNPAQAIGLMGEATVLMGVPTFYTRLLNTPGFTREATAGMRLFVSGSAPLLSETHKRFEDLTGHAILERYGMTETIMNSSNPYDGARRAGTVGLPLPGIDIRVTDPASGKVLSTDEIGMIEVRGPNVFKGYWRMPEKTAAEFRADGYFITGDLGVLDGDGYLSIVGRGKDLVISGGYNVYPKEVETEIDLLPGVLESAVIGLPHRDLGEAVTAVVVADGSADIDEDSLIAALSQKLARFKQPKRVLFVEELPRNTMGKVQKAELRSTCAGLYG